jgi:hypothetical protein
MKIWSTRDIIREKIDCLTWLYSKGCTIVITRTVYTPNHLWQRYSEWLNKSWWRRQTFSKWFIYVIWWNLVIMMNSEIYQRFCIDNKTRWYNNNCSMYKARNIVHIYFPRIKDIWRFGRPGTSFVIIWFTCFKLFYIKNNSVKNSVNL